MKKILLWIFRMFIGLVAVILLMQGALWAFMPESNMLTNGISASSPLGINMIKSDIGAGLLSAAIFTLLFLIKGQQWFLPTIIMILSYLLIRISSFVIDGSHPTIIIGITLEMAMLLAVIALNKLQTSPKGML